MIKEQIRLGLMRDIGNLQALAKANCVSLEIKFKLIGHNVKLGNNNMDQGKTDSFVARFGSKVSVYLFEQQKDEAYDSWHSIIKEAAKLIIEIQEERNHEQQNPNIFKAIVAKFGIEILDGY